MKKSKQHHVRPPRGKEQVFHVPGRYASDCIAWMDRQGWNSDDRDDRGEPLAIDYTMCMHTDRSRDHMPVQLVVRLWDRRRIVMFKLAWGGL